MLLSIGVFWKITQKKIKTIHLVGILLFVLVPVILTRSGGMFFLSLVKGPMFTREVLTS